MLAHESPALVPFSETPVCPFLSVPLIHQLQGLSGSTCVCVCGMINGSWPDLKGKHTRTHTHTHTHIHTHTHTHTPTHTPTHTDELEKIETNTLIYLRELSTATPEPLCIFSCLSPFV